MPTVPRREQASLSEPQVTGPQNAMHTDLSSLDFSDFYNILSPTAINFEFNMLPADIDPISYEITTSPNGQLTAIPQTENMCETTACMEEVSLPNIAPFADNEQTSLNGAHGGRPEISERSHSSGRPQSANKLSPIEHEFEPRFSFSELNDLNFDDIPIAGHDYSQLHEYFADNSSLREHPFYTRDQNQSLQDSFNPHQSQYLSGSYQANANVPGYPTPRPYMIDHNNTTESSFPESSLLLRPRPNPSMHTKHPQAININESQQGIDARYVSPTNSVITSPNGEQRRDHLHYRAERPKKDEDKPWTRTNGTTKGLSTRCGKINRYNPTKDGGYEVETRHPCGNWTSSKFDFRYHSDGELSKTVYSTEAIRQFIYEHSAKESDYLTLFIQKTPADSSRRYQRSTSSKCKFADCPARDYGNTIVTGHFRVALDDQWGTYGERRDPFIVAGYVHLYCLERFLDFPSICKRFNVQVDDRQFPSEPRGRWAARIDKEQEQNVVGKFINYCRNGTLLEKYPEYPAHNSVRAGAEKYHRGTLTYALNVAKMNGTNKSKKTMFESRGLKQSTISVHLGDLQMYVNGRKAQTPKTNGRQPLDDLQEEEQQDVHFNVSQPQPKRKRSHTSHISDGSHGQGAEAKRARLLPSVDTEISYVAEGMQNGEDDFSMGDEESPKRILSDSDIPMDPGIVEMVRKWEHGSARQAQMQSDLGRIFADCIA